MNNGLDVNAGGMSGDGKRTIQSSEEFGQELIWVMGDKKIYLLLIQIIII